MTFTFGVIYHFHTKYSFIPNFTVEEKQCSITYADEAINTNNYKSQNRVSNLRGKGLGVGRDYLNNLKTYPLETDNSVVKGLGWGVNVARRHQWRGVGRISVILSIIR